MNQLDTNGTFKMSENLLPTLYTHKTESISKVFHSFTILSEYIDNAPTNKNRLLRTDLLCTLQYETSCVRTLKRFGKFLLIVRMNMNLNK